MACPLHQIQKKEQKYFLFQIPPVIQTDNGKNEQANETQAGYQHIDVVVDNNTPAIKNEEDESEIDTYI